MSSLSGFLKLFFDLSPIFKVEHTLAVMIGASVTPTLLLIAIYLRVSETAIDALVSGGKWGRMLKDILLYSAVLGSYWEITAYVINLVNPIYAWFDGKGSIDLVMRTFSALKATNSKNLDVGSAMTAMLGGSLYVVVTGFLYYISLAVLSFIALFLAIAHAVLFGLALCWGLIAIPISISENLRILRGWAYLTGLVIAWPIVQGLLTAMFTALFLHAATQMQSADANAIFQLGDLQLLFSILHLLMSAVLVAAPFVANALVTNAPSAAAAVTPFVGAAIAAGVATATATKDGTQALRARIQGGATPAISPSLSTPRARTTAPAAMAEANSAPVSSGAPGAEASGSDVPKARQQRRGAIVNQLRRNVKETP